MKLKQINFIVLYSKNWYKHTDDIVADCKKYVGMDHSNLDVEKMSNSELFQLMKTDYLNWIDSITKEDNVKISISDLRESLNNAVCWECDPEERVVWNIISNYSKYIPDFGCGLKPPTYNIEKGLMPQRFLNRAVLDPFAALAGNATDKELTRAAIRYFNQSHIEVMKNCFLEALKKFDFKSIGEIMAALNVRGIRDPKRGGKRVERICYTLWNKAKRKMNEKSGQNSFVLTDECVSMIVRPKDMEIELQYIPISYSVNNKDVDNTVSKNLYEALFEHCVEHIDKDKFAAVICYNNKNFSETAASEHINKICNSIKNKITNNSSEKTYSVDNLHISKDTKNMSVYYVAVRSFGAHMNELFNIDRAIPGRKD